MATFAALHPGIVRRARVAAAASSSSSSYGVWSAAAPLSNIPVLAAQQRFQCECVHAVIVLVRSFVFGQTTVGVYTMQRTNYDPDVLIVDVGIHCRHVGAGGDVRC